MSSGKRSLPTEESSSDAPTSPSRRSNLRGNSHSRSVDARSSFDTASDADAEEDAACADATPPSTPPARRTSSLPSQLRAPSLFGFLSREFVLTAPLADENDPISSEKHRRVVTVFQVPPVLEQLLWFGLILCLDSFLFMITVLPLRILFSLPRHLFTFVRRLFNANRNNTDQEKRDRGAALCDVMRLLMIVAVTLVLSRLDLSRLYHAIRGQSSIKLYVIYNMLEVVDRLFSSVGQDIMDTLYWLACSVQTRRRRDPFYLFLYFLLATTYVLFHAVTKFSQILTLNVAFLSHNNSITALILSNQFIELKSSVFKSFSESTLFHVTSSDMVERFAVLTSLSLVSVLNMAEVGWDGSYFRDHMVVLIATMLLSEIFLDCIKHSFITKFNRISARVYTRYLSILSRDLLRPTRFLDSAHLASSRLGFSALPILCVVLRILLFTALPSLHIPFPLSHFLPILFTALLALKLSLGFLLRLWAAHNVSHSQANDFHLDQRKYGPGDPLERAISPLKQHRL